LEKIVIVGAGVCGLTLGYHLTQAGFPVVIIEKGPVIGGLARSFRNEGFTFDIGPHRFYSTNPLVMDFLRKVLGSDHVIIARNSAVHFLGEYHTWPLRLRSIFQMPLAVSFRAFLDLFNKRFQKQSDDPTFENYILAKYGRTLYDTFFKDYTEKFLGIPARSTHQNWAKIGVERATIDEKVTTGSIFQIFKLMLMPVPRRLHFLYPLVGVDVFCERLRDKIEAMGGEILTGAVPEEIEAEGGRITALTAGGRRHIVKELIWSGSLIDLAPLVGIETPGLEYLSLIIYNVRLKSKPLQDYQWCYYGARDIVFSRVTNTNLFHSDMTPPGKGGLCVEVTARPGDDLWSDPQTLADSIVEQLVRVHVIKSGDQVEGIDIEKIRDAYPVYDCNYLAELEGFRRRLDESLANCHLAGRTGLFWYNNMDHSIENAFLLSGKILGRMASTPESRKVLDELAAAGALAIQSEL
jgi:protoporphyrinogen oxidase